MLANTELFFLSRDVSDYKTRVDAYSREILRKEATIRDLQARLENGEGSEYTVHFLGNALPTYCRS